jgi:LPXTG-motif cell wall-anchored protein
MRVRKVLALTLAIILVLGSFTFAFAKTKYDLEGYTLDPNEKWTDGVLKGWAEGQWVPYKISVEDYDGSTITVRHDYLLSGTVNGFDDTDNWSINGTYSEGNGFSVSGPTKSSGSNASVIEYVVELDQQTIDDLMGQNFVLYWEAHLSVTGGPDLIDGGTVDQGPSYWTGASLQTRFVEADETVSLQNVEAFNYGSITIQKDVVGMDDTTTFDVNVTGPDGYSETVTIAEGSPATLNDLLYGTYTLTEVDDENYIMDDSETVVVGENNLNHTITFENTMKTYEMSIEKEATPANLQVGGVITYSITVTNDGNQPLTDITLTDPTVGLTETFDLAVDGEETFMVTMQAMTAGEIINVAEATDDMAGTVTDSAIVNVTEDPTGSITFFKDVTNETDDPTPFMFHVSGPNNYGAYTQVLETDTDGVTLDNLVLGTYTFYEEVPEGYTGVTTSGSITLADVEGQLNQSFTFENTKDTQYGTLTIEKEVYIDGDMDEQNQTVFEFEVNGETVTASAIMDGQIVLPVGTYVVTETGYGDFVPDATTQQAVVTTEGTTVTFVNRYTTPETGTLIFTKDVTYVEGRDSTMFNVTVTFPDQSTTQIAIQDQSSVTLSGLDFGQYSWEEEIPEGYEGVSNTTGTIWVGGESPNTRTVNIVNRRLEDELGSVTVYKVIYGEQDESDFNFRLYAGQGTEGTIVAQTSVDINNPEFIGGLEEGWYTVGEDPSIEGYIIPMPYEFYLDSGEDRDVTIENTPIPLEIEKTVDDPSVYVNEDVTYTIKVTNTGNFTLYDVLVEDEQLGYSTTISMLDPGEDWEVEIETSYSSTGDKENTAKASTFVETPGQPNGFLVEVEDDATVDVNSRPSRNTYRMTIEKEADGDFYEVGDTITYTIVVENTGNSRLTDIEVTDDMTGLSETIGSLNPGETEEFETTYVAQESDIGDLTNTATAEDDRAGTEEDDVTVTVEGVPEGVPEYTMTIKKTAMTEGEIFSGDMVEFEIVVTNTGNETLTNILVEDDMVDFEAVIDELEPGESEDFTVKVEAPNVPGPFTNTATATSEETGTQQADDTVFVEEPIPLDVPDTGVAPTDLFFGLGALVSGLGVFFTKKRK